MKVPLAVLRICTRGSQTCESLNSRWGNIARAVLQVCSASSAILVTDTLPSPIIPQMGKIVLSRVMGLQNRVSSSVSRKAFVSKCVPTCVSRNGSKHDWFSTLMAALLESLWEPTCRNPFEQMLLWIAWKGGHMFELKPWQQPFRQHHRSLWPVFAIWDHG